jgi:hypothetical protein
VIKIQPLTPRETKPNAQYLQHSLGTNFQILDPKFLPLQFYKDVFIIAPQTLDLGHSLKLFKTITGTGCPNRLSVSSDRALRASKNELAGIGVRTP